ncbi:MAG: septum formation initiator family protein [Hydrogenovibrio sp.]|nr:septum formation initiator family protein [Hydrogenovibrio sp.]
MKTIYIVLGVIILILQMRLMSSDGGIGDYLSLQKKLDDLQVKVHDLEHKNSLLKKEVYDLQTNTKGIETIARQKLGMIGENEVFVKVIELSPVQQSQLNAGKSSTLNPSNPAENGSSPTDSTESD